MVRTIKSDKDFSEQLIQAGNRLVVVDFMATWCGPCKAIAPTLKELSVRFANKIVVLKVDVDKCEKLSTQYKVRGMPTFVFIKNGIKVASFSGADEDKLKNYIIKYSPK